MPAATFNHDRAVGQQLQAGRSQSYQQMLDDETNAARQAHNLAQQYNQDLMNGVPNTTHTIETIVMSMALEQDVDLSSFSLASQGIPSHSNPSNNPSGQAQQGSADINQTQLLSGSRT
ncbi:hypothetical protein EDD11_000824 [Mortierella claussenii]|nr:hypothetical protein EDD11_000824 [Mortierella claussenii]